MLVKLVFQLVRIVLFHCTANDHHKTSVSRLCRPNEDERLYGRHSINMTQSLLRPPTTLQPRPKANPTFSSLSISSQITVKTPQQSRPPSETRQSASPRPSSTPLPSDKINVALIRKVLCPQQTNIANDTWPIDELLPPLSSSNEVDLQLYTIIAIVVQQLVYSWYGQITSDEAFVEEVVRILAHCTRAVEGRLRKIDLESLLLDEIPGLVESHILGPSSCKKFNACFC